MTDKTTKKKIERIVRIKKRILKESSNLEKNYKTTFKDIKKYFSFFNKALFKEQLNPFNDIQIKKNEWLLGSVCGRLFVKKRYKIFLSGDAAKIPE